MRPWRLGGLLWQFAILSLVVLVMLGLALSVLIARVLERNGLQEAAVDARQAVSGHLVRYLSPEDLPTPMQGLRYAQFARFVEENVKSSRTARIKLWDREGRVIFSDDAAQVGRFFPIKSELATALGGEVATDISGLSDEENSDERPYGQLLEIYAPVVFPGSTEVVGAFEVYQFYEPYRQVIQAAQRELYAALAIGLLLFYSALFAVVKRGHDTIRRQRDHLTAINEAALAVAAELSLDAVLQRILELAGRLVPSQYAALGAVNQSGQLRQIVSGVPCCARMTTDECPAETKRLLVWILRGGHTLRVRSLAEDPDGAGDRADRLGLLSFLGVPIRVGEHMVGAFYLANRQGRSEFSQEDQELLERLAAHAALAIDKAGLLAALKDRAQQLEEAYQATLESLSAALDLRDGGTESHSRRASQRIALLTQAVGVPTEEQADIMMGACLHDIGKIGVPDAILRKPGPLTEDEWLLMRLHPQLGYEMLAPIRFLAKAAPIVRYHHESYDGRGYPDGLRGPEIPLGARIFAIADTYDAITSDRPYRKRRSHREAVEEIVRCAGTQFDPDVVAAFLRVGDQFAEPSGPQEEDKTVGRSTGLARRADERVQFVEAGT